jgi:xanthine/CO dehydrogenase XdhC/CoxF family maturation factor
MAIERTIIDAASRLRRSREPHLVATVVRVQGATYRRPGARMLLTQFRWISGSVSGGSLEDDLATKGWQRTRDGEAVILRYDSRSPAGLNEDVRAAFGLGCDGVVDVMLERSCHPGRIDPMQFAETCVRSQRRGAIVTVIRSEAPGIRTGMRVAVMERDEANGDKFDTALRAGMIADARAAIATGESCNRTYRSDLGNVDVFIEAMLPPPCVFVFGTGHDAVPLVALVRSLGWEVCVCTDAPREIVRQRFPHIDEILTGSPLEIAARVDECDRAVAIVMNHKDESDRRNLGVLVHTRARYIGVLGPRARTQRMLAELGHGVSGDMRIRAPLGLDIGAGTPQEVALAIVAEVQSVLTRTNADKQLSRTTTVMPRIAQAVAAAGPVTGPHKRLTVDNLVTVAS